MDAINRQKRVQELGRRSAYVLKQTEVQPRVSLERPAMVSGGLADRAYRQMTQAPQTKAVSKERRFRQYSPRKISDMWLRQADLNVDPIYGLAARPEADRWIPQSRMAAINASRKESRNSWSKNDPCHKRPDSKKAAEAKKSGRGGGSFDPRKWC